MNPEITIDDCWNKKGSWGDGTTLCSRLDFFGHCFNCDIYSGAGRKLLDRTSPTGYLEEWTELVGNVAQKSDGGIASLLIFSIWGNYFALSTRFLVRVTEFQPLHRIPHSRNKAVMGLANIVGELVVVVSLLSAVKASGYNKSDEGLRFKRIIVLQLGHYQWAIPVSDIYGIHKINVAERKTDGSALQSDCVETSFSWEEKIVHFIAHERLEKLLEEIRF